MTPDPNLAEDLRLLEPWNTLWLWVGVAAIGLVVALFLLARRHRRRSAPALSSRVVATAREDALQALLKLEALLQPELSRQYAIESTAIVRRYIEDRYQIRAPRQATEEFLVDAAQSPRLEKDHQPLLTDYLGICDLLKFARHQADRPELQNLHEAALRFVRQTSNTPPQPAEAK